MQKKRQGFTLIMAIWVLVAMTSMMAIMLSYSSQTLQQTTQIYTREQAQLLAKSATEYALLAISAHDRTVSNDCINHINATFAPNGVTSFDINTTIRHIGFASLACNDLPGAETISTAESNGTVIIDTYVTSRDLNPVIRYHRRTIQKP